MDKNEQKKLLTEIMEADAKDGLYKEDKTFKQKSKWTKVKSMTPAEKADELVTKYRRYLPMNLTTMLDAKNCAMIAVQERIDEGYEWMGGGNTEWEKDRYNYLQEVKQEIEKL